jgi:hypothetical protein
MMAFSCLADGPLLKAAWTPGKGLMTVDYSQIALDPNILVYVMKKQTLKGILTLKSYH